MTVRHVAFIRNVMIGREGLHRVVLLDLFDHAGSVQPRSYISTGNVTFSAAPAAVDGIRERVENAIATVIGRREEVFVRTITHLEALVASDPFAESPFPDAVEKTVSFTLHPVELGDQVLPVLSHREDVALFDAAEQEVFTVSRMVGGRTSSGGGLVERITGQRVTTRNWNTVLRIASDPEPLGTPEVGSRSD